MGSGQHLGKPRRSLACAAALLFELGEALLELGRHPVERVGDLGELVAPANLDALVQLAAGDRVGAADEAAQRADDREAEHVREPAEREHGGQQAHHDPPAIGGDRRVELALGRKGGELDAPTRAGKR